MNTVKPPTTPGAPGVKANASAAKNSGVVNGFEMNTGFLPERPSNNGALPFNMAPANTTETWSLASISWAHF